jgi:hypothetical protein
MRNRVNRPREIGNTAQAAVLVLTAGIALAAAGQSSAKDSSPQAAPAAVPYPIIRQIDDPHSGEVWLLLRDPGNPGGPGRLVPAAQSAKVPGSARQDLTQPIKCAPVIRAGEQVLVEEHSARVDARLEAVALSSAAKGEKLRARLKIGGNVVVVVASAPGSAVLEPESEGQR